MSGALLPGNQPWGTETRPAARATLQLPGVVTTVGGGVARDGTSRAR